MINPPSQDPYMILGLSPGATGTQIKKAYRRLAMKFHPDRNRNDPAMENKFKQILWAYERLRKQKRPQTVLPRDDPQRSNFNDSADPFFNFFATVISHYLKKKEGK